MRPDNSASNLFRRWLCPGSGPAEKGLISPDGPDAVEGHLLHEVYSGGKDISTLKPDQKWTMETAYKRRDELVNDSIKEIVRKEVNLTFDNPLIPGHGDEIFFGPDNDALIVDLKCGRIPVEPAQANYQLRAYAWGLHYLFPSLTQIYAGINQPRLPKEDSISLVGYQTRDFPVIEQEISGILTESSKPDAKRIPSSKACQYCKAFGTPRCPETLELMNESEIIPLADSQLTAEQYAFWLPRIPLLEKACTKVKEDAKAFVKAGGNIPGWYLKPGAKPREIEDPQSAYLLLSKHLSAEEFASCCEIGLGKLETIIAKKKDLSLPRAKNLVNETLATVIKTKENAPSLKSI